MRLDSLKLRLQVLWFDYREVVLTICLLCCVLPPLYFLGEVAEDYSIKKWSEGCKSLGAVPHVIEGNRFCITKEKPNE
jgi:hypothetical protein